MNTHVEGPLLSAYAHGDVDAAHAYSVEAHLAGCGRCRGALAPLADHDRLERVWLNVEDSLDAPKPGPVEALLRRVGVPEHLARLLATTPSLTASWLTGTAVAVAFAVTAAHQSERGLLLFLTLAALLPVAGVAAAFGPALNPTYEVALAAPMSSVRLLLARATAVLGTTLVLTAAGAIALPSAVGWTAAAWLLPSLALTASSLALATYVTPLAAVCAVAGAWIVGAVVAAAAPVDRLAAFHAGGQIGFAALLVLAAGIVVLRHDRLDVVKELA